MRPPSGTFVSVWPGRRWTRMFRLTSCFATGPEILLWWVGNLTPTPTTRPTLLVGALTARLRWTPLVSFEAPLGLFPPWDLSLVPSRAFHGWGCPPSFVGLCLCFVQCTALLYAFGRCPFCGKAAFYVSFGFSFAPLPLLVAFTPVFILY